jgi:hypothetical protein
MLAPFQPVGAAMPPVGAVLVASAKRTVMVVTAALIGLGVPALGGTSRRPKAKKTTSQVVRAPRREELAVATEQIE